MDLIKYKSALVQIMPWPWTGSKPLSETVMAYFADPYMLPFASMNLPKIASGSIDNLFEINTFNSTYM